MINVSALTTSLAYMFTKNSIVDICVQSKGKQLYARKMFDEMLM
jgi:predicted transport protein